MRSPQIFYQTNNNHRNQNDGSNQNQATIVLDIANMTTNNGLLTRNNPNYAFTYGAMNANNNVNNNIPRRRHYNEFDSKIATLPPLYVENPFATHRLSMPHPPSATYSVSHARSQLQPPKPDLAIPPPIQHTPAVPSNHNHNPFVRNMMSNNLNTFTAVFPLEIDCNDDNLATSISNSISNVLDKKITVNNRKNNNVKLEHGCKDCGKQFKHKSNLKIHRIVHTKSALKCDYCGKRFARKGNLKQHLRVHTDERPYSCGFCEKAFKQPHSLKDHLRIHTGEKPFSCEYCGKSFNVKHNMVIHRRLHTGERPFHCNICSKQFASKSSLNGHTKKFHPQYWSIQHSK